MEVKHRKLRHNQHREDDGANWSSSSNHHLEGPVPATLVSRLFSRRRATNSGCITRPSQASADCWQTFEMQDTSPQIEDRINQLSLTGHRKHKKKRQQRLVVCKLFLSLLIAYEIFTIHLQTNGCDGRNGNWSPLAATTTSTFDWLTRTQPESPHNGHGPSTNYCLRSLLAPPIGACSAQEVVTQPPQPKQQQPSAAPTTTTTTVRDVENTTSSGQQLSDATDEAKERLGDKNNVTSMPIAASSPPTAPPDATNQAQNDDKRAGAATVTAPATIIRQRMSDVVCNSRCNCVKLEFNSEQPAASEGAINVDKTQTLTATMDDDERNEARANRTTGPSELATGAGATAANGSKLGQSEQATAMPTALTSGQGNKPAGPDANQIALIEFSQDYSFDEHDELDEDAVGGGGAVGQPHERDSELHGYASTATMTSLSSTNNTATNNNSHADGGEQTTSSSSAPGGSGLDHGLGATSLMLLPEAPLPHLTGGAAGPLEQLASEQSAPSLPLGPSLGTGSGQWPTIKTAAKTTLSGFDQSSGGGGGSLQLEVVPAAANEIKSSPQPNGAEAAAGQWHDESAATAKRRKKQRLMIDQLDQLPVDSGAGSLLAHERNYNYNKPFTSNAGGHQDQQLAVRKPPVPLNGHSLLLPSFNVKQKGFGGKSIAAIGSTSAGGAFSELIASPVGSEGGVGGPLAGSADQLFMSLHSHLHNNYQRNNRRNHQTLLQANGSSFGDSVGAPFSDGNEETLRIDKIAPLDSLDMSSRNLGELLSTNCGGPVVEPTSGSNSSSNRTYLALKEALVELDQVGQDRPIESLVLRNNNIKFELWTQLYSLLLVQMRSRLYHLDLSHNSLIKLGVTFTGYIEHHFVYQLLRSNGTDQSWPFSASTSAQRGPIRSQLINRASSNNNMSERGLYGALGQLGQGQSVALGLAEASATDQGQTGRESALTSAGVGDGTAAQQQQQQQQPTTTAGGYMANYLKLINQFQMSGSSTSSLPSSSSSKRLFRRPLLGDGRIYNLIRSELPLTLNPVLTSSPNGTAATTKLSANQQLIQMILHQPAKICALDLSYNKLKWLINDQFRILKHVQAIRLDHNRIRFIHQQAFNGLVALKYLNLNYNRLQTIYMEQFQTNYNLLALFMKANYLTYLRAGSLASQTNLRRLDLSRNKFAILSNNAFVGLDSLQVLNLSSNSFVHVPSASFHPLMMSLKQLDLSDNQLTQLMPGAFFHLQLEKIWLNDNDQLVSIDRGAFWDMPQLSCLSLKSNSLLMNVNQQAFVGVPNLRQIITAECPLLDTQTKQMLDNITQANTMRSILRQQQIQLLTGTNRNSSASQNATIASPKALSEILSTTMESTRPLFSGMGEQNSNNSIASSTSNLTLLSATEATTQMAAAAQSGLQATTNESLIDKKLAKKSLTFNELLVRNEYEQQMSIQLQYDQTSATTKMMKYFYSLGGLMLIVVALKLVPARHYLDSRRQRRRVYQSSHGAGESCADHRLSMSSSSMSSSADETPSEAQSFAMVEQQPDIGAIIRPLQQTMTNDQPDNSDTGEGNTGQEPLEEVALDQPAAEDGLSADVQAAAAAAAAAAIGCPDCLSEMTQLQCCDQSVGQSSYHNDQLLAAGLYELGHANCAHYYSCCDDRIPSSHEAPATVPVEDNSYNYHEEATTNNNNNEDNG